MESVGPVTRTRDCQLNFSSEQLDQTLMSKISSEEYRIWERQMLYQAVLHNRTGTVGSLLPILNESDRAFSAQLLADAIGTGNSQLVAMIADLPWVDVSGSPLSGHPFLAFAVEGGCAEITNLLLDRGANIGTRDREDRTALHYAACDSKPSGTEMVRLLLRRSSPIEVNIQDDSGRTSLWYCVEQGTLERVNELLHGQADPDISDQWGDTPIHVAVEGRNLGVLNKLLKFYAHAHVRRCDGNNPLHLAYMQNWEEGILCLEVENAAMKNERNYEGLLPEECRPLFQNEPADELTSSDSNSDLNPAAASKSDEEAGSNKAAIIAPNTSPTLNSGPTSTSPVPSSSNSPDVPPTTPPSPTPSTPSPISSRSSFRSSMPPTQLVDSSPRPKKKQKVHGGSHSPFDNAENQSPNPRLPFSQ